MLVVFTDLDGTLLDHNTYSFEPALPAVQLLKKHGIPLIFCSSKTRAEIEEVRRLLDNTHPFVSENGGAVFIPKGYFSVSFHYDRDDGGYLILELGTPYSRLREVLQEMSKTLPGNVTGFGDLSPVQVADLCGFSVDQASLAKKREYDEPFILKDRSAENVIQDLAERSGLQITKGGRFYHLMGNNEKGQTVRLLRNIYHNESGIIKTIGLGDSLNDLPLLEAVDYPVLVQKPDGSYDPQVKIDNLIKAPTAGPAGWCQAVRKLLDNLS